MNRTLVVTLIASVFLCLGATAMASTAGPRQTLCVRRTADPLTSLDGSKIASKEELGQTNAGPS